MHCNDQMYAGSRITNAETRGKWHPSNIGFEYFPLLGLMSIFFVEYYVMCRYRPLKKKVCCNLPFAVSASNL
jgi:hypothetical protein